MRRLSLAIVAILPGAAPADAPVPELVKAGVFTVAPYVVAGGVPELVQHSETGLLVPPRNPEALASALAELLTNAELRGRLGRAARQQAQERFSVARQVDQLDTLATDRSNPRVAQ